MATGHDQAESSVTFAGIRSYFPTDEATLERIAQMVQVSDTGSHRLLDPCCGEGSALADLRNALVERHRAD
ncbi:MAG: hypothetical protein ABI212_13200, partial [Burkholderiaceae bacterium]